MIGWFCPNCGYQETASGDPETYATLGYTCTHCGAPVEPAALSDLSNDLHPTKPIEPDYAARARAEGLTDGWM